MYTVLNDLFKQWFMCEVVEGLLQYVCCFFGFLLFEKQIV
jgi:hypothetical protein